MLSKAADFSSHKKGEKIKRSLMILLACCSFKCKENGIFLGGWYASNTNLNDFEYQIYAIVQFMTD